MTIKCVIKIYNMTKYINKIPNMASYCTSLECKNPTTHNILSHLCGMCGNFGHGIFECGKLLSYSKIIEIPLNEQCTVKECRYSKSHTTGGHFCRLCKTYGHSFKSCINASPKNIAKDARGPIYVTTYAGMGCFEIHKRLDSDHPFITFFMGQDAWGQYGHSDVPKLEKFVEGYKPLRKCDNLLNQTD